MGSLCSGRDPAATSGGVATTVAAWVAECERALSRALQCSTAKGGIRSCGSDGRELIGHWWTMQWALFLCHRILPPRDPFSHPRRRRSYRWIMVATAASLGGKQPSTRLLGRDAAVLSWNSSAPMGGGVGIPVAARHGSSRASEWTCFSPDD